METVKELPPVENPAQEPEMPPQPPEETLSVEERLASLSQQILSQMEQASQAEKQRRTVLDAREEALFRRELMAGTRAELEKRGLPAAFADCMAFADADAMEKGVALLEACFRAQVQLAVEARLLDSPPKTAALRPLQELPDEEYYAAVCRTHE